MTLSPGHRQRLRQRFQSDPASLSQVQRLELLLTYAIPRVEVAALAEELIARFGSLTNILSAPKDELLEVPGIGEATVSFFELLQTLLTDDDMGSQNTGPVSEQLHLFNLATEIENSKPVSSQPKERQMRVFTNDEIHNSLELLPKAADFVTYEEYKRYLRSRLPYNAAETRARRANHILDRFFPDGHFDTPFKYFVSKCSSQADLKPAVFYHVLKAEPIAARVAEEFIWPALPVGSVERETMRNFILQYLPDAGTSSQRNMLRAIYYTYSLLGVATSEDVLLRFRLHSGTLESFLYLLTSEYPQPGMYSFDSLFNGPLHHWLLWDREWMRRQLYNLQDFGILAKISEIDSVRQFTLSMDQGTALHTYFEHPERNILAIREKPEDQDLQ